MKRLALALIPVVALAAACSGKKKHGAPGPTTIDVHGTVVYDRTHAGVPSIAVLTSGLSPVTTANDGTFTLTGVTPPYTLALIDSTTKTGAVWIGLTAKQPILPWTAATTRAAQVSGTVTGLTGASVSLTATSPHGGSGYASVNFSTGVFTNGPLAWLGPATDSFTLWAIGQSPTPGVGATAAGSTTLALTDGMPATGVSVAMAAVTPAPFDLTVTNVPVGSSAATQVFVSDANRALAAQIAGASVTSSGTVAMPFPQVPGAAGYAALVYASPPSGAVQEVELYGLTGASGTVALAGPVTETLPVDAATNITSATPFSWAPESSPAVYEIVFTPLTTGDPKYAVFTTKTTATIPDLSAAGLSLPSGVSYFWTVSSFGPNASIDDFAANGDVAPSSGSRFNDGSDTRSFTTQ